MILLIIFQSVYKAGYRCKITLLIVYNGMDTTIERGDYVMLVLHTLSAAVETIDHDHFF